ncbi:helix-turn-helix domain-containing protein [Flagellimonas olearia]|uniref:Helix-turn-helix domain-containing protein n=1 Tax=Flagellimonas olearia TaxID=552546 RepID=A0A6I1DTZ3_9FLAO|nr:helix-turn-helix transcriptional regulator [Allomuricauda olearia]KAB7528250.1 helix-turn-helix domain-containing protein [Allomuricauda olearia]
MSITDEILIAYQKKLGQRIKEVREGKELSQLDVASICDYDKTTISRIENGRTNITLKTLVTLALAMEVDISQLFEFKD